MKLYNIEIDDGDGNIETISVEAKDEDEAISLAKQKLLTISNEADLDLMVVISLWSESKSS